MASWGTQLRLLQLSCDGGMGDVTDPAPVPTEFLQALLQQGIAAQDAGTQPRSAECFYHSMQRGVQALVVPCLAASSTEQQTNQIGQLLEAASKCLHVFVRHNMSGPWRPPPPSPIELIAPDLHAAPSTLKQDTSSDAAAPQNTCSSSAASNGTSSSTGQTTGLGDETRHPHERWAAQQLAFDGEDVVGSVQGLQWLWLAELLLVQPLLGVPAAASSSPSGGPVWQPGVSEALLTAWPSWGWWALRVVLCQQQVLDGRSAQLWGRLQLLTAQLLGTWAAPAMQQLLPEGQSIQSLKGVVATQTQGSTGAPSVASDCVTGLVSQPATLACLLLELSLGHHAYGYVDTAERLLVDTGAVLGLEVQLTGALGKRTVHQVDAKAQLVVRVGRSRRAAPASSDHDMDVSGLVLGVDRDPHTAASTTTAAQSPGDIQDSAGTGAAGDGSGAGTGVLTSPPTSETAGLCLEEDVFLAPQLLDEEGQKLESVYSGVEQALLLSWARHVKTATAQDELQVWQMAPYVEAVLMQRRSQPMLQAQAHLLKIRHEAHRNRTRERALVHMEQLVEVLEGGRDQPNQQPAQWGHSVGGSSAATWSDPASWTAAHRRLPFIHCCGLPLSSRLRKELAQQYLALGFVGAAVKLFESLEAWDALVLCYRLMDKKHLAEEIIKKRLQVTPDDPSLWCGLGDLHLDDSHYETAWERSGHRHARSKRSLGHSALRRKDYQAAAGHLEQALALNPLNPDAWFALGYAYLKLQGKQHQALKAFTRVTQQQPDHGEAWNNMAALFSDLGRPKEAFSALSHCVRHKRDSWHIWENFASVAVKAGAYTQAVNALKEVLQITHGQRLPLETVQALVSEVEHPTTSTDTTSNGPATEPSELRVGEDGADDSWQLGQDDLGSWVQGLTVAEPTEEVVGEQGQGAASEAAAPSQFQKDLQAEQERTTQLLRSSLGSLLKEAVNLPCCAPGLWGCLGRYYRATGHPESAKEAFLKQVRALTGTSYRSDEKKFQEMAQASLDLAQAYVDLYRLSVAPSGAGADGAGGSGIAPKPAVRELAAARMHLRGVLKQCEQAFGEQELWKRMDEVLKEVVKLEDEAVAASKSSA